MHEQICMKHKERIRGMQQQYAATCSATAPPPGRDSVEGKGGGRGERGADCMDAAPQGGSGEGRGVRTRKAWRCSRCPARNPRQVHLAELAEGRRRAGTGRSPARARHIMLIALSRGRPAGGMEGGRAGGRAGGCRREGRRSAHRAVHVRRRMPAAGRPSHGGREAAQAGKLPVGLPGVGSRRAAHVMRSGCLEGLASRLTDRCCVGRSAPGASGRRTGP